MKFGERIYHAIMVGPMSELKQRLEPIVKEANSMESKIQETKDFLEQELIFETKHFKSRRIKEFLKRLKR